VAGLTAFMANTECFEPDDIATKVLPAIVTTLIDQEKVVRDQAFKTLYAYLKKLETHVSTLPVSANTASDSRQEGEGEYHAISPNSIVTSATGAAGVLAGWTWASIGKKISAGELSETSILSGSIMPQSPNDPSDSSHYSHTPSVKAMQLPNPRSKDLSDLADDLQEEDQPLIDMENEFNDWGSFEVPTTAAINTPPICHKEAGENDRVVQKDFSHMQSKAKLIALDPKPKELSSSSSIVSKEEKIAEMARRKEERKQVSGKIAGK